MLLLGENPLPERHQASELPKIAPDDVNPMSRSYRSQSYGFEEECKPFRAIVRISFNKERIQSGVSPYQGKCYFRS
jgi:hypothetical protein